MGACGLAPVVLVGEKVYGRVSLASVRKILDEYENKEETEELSYSEQVN